MLFCAYVYGYVGCDTPDLPTTAPPDKAHLRLPGDCIYAYK